MRAAVAAVLACLALGASACDTLLVDPPPAEARYETVTVRAAAGADVIDEVFAQVDRATVRMVFDGRMRWDTSVAAAPVDGAVRLRLRVPDTDAAGPIDLSLALWGRDASLFAGEGAVRNRGDLTGPDSLRVGPTAASLETPQQPLRFNALGDTQALAPPVARWATGQIIPGAEATWWSERPEVVEVVDGGSAVARGNGAAWLVARYGGAVDSVSVNVEQEFATSVPRAVLPASATIGVGGMVGFRLDGVDRNGNPLEPGARVGLYAVDAGVVVLMGGGYAVGVCPGETEVTTPAASAPARVTVRPATEDPPAALLWSRTEAGLVGGDVSGGYRSMGAPGAVHPTRDPSGGSIAFVVDGSLRIGPAGGPYRTLATGAGAVTRPEFTADGQWIYYALEDAGRSRIHRIRPDGSEGGAVTPDSLDARWPTTHPDDGRVAFLVGQDLMVLDEWGDVTVLHRRAVAPAWSPDGGWIAFLERITDTHGRVRVVRPDGSGGREILGPVVLQALTWSPDGHQLLTHTPNMILFDLRFGRTAELCWSADPGGLAWWR